MATGNIVTYAFAVVTVLSMAFLLGEKMNEATNAVC
jgi:hypothetical protein